MSQIDVGQNCKALPLQPSSAYVSSQGSDLAAPYLFCVVTWHDHTNLKLLLKQSTETAAHIEAFGKEMGLTKYDFLILSA